MIWIANRVEILNAVEDALKKLTNEFIRNPMRFFSEKDFHWYFCHLLNKKLIEKSLPNRSGLIETSFERNRGEYYKTMIVHQEYGTVGGEGKRIDVVVLDPQDVERINGPDLKLNKKFLPPLIAIEFGTEKNKLLTGIDKYCQKLKKMGSDTEKYMVVYYRDLTKSKEGRIHQKHQAKMRELRRKVKEASEKPGLNVICVIYYRDTHKYEKYEGGHWHEKICGQRLEKEKGSMHGLSLVNY